MRTHCYGKHEEMTEQGTGWVERAEEAHSHS